MKSSHRKSNLPPFPVPKAEISDPSNFTYQRARPATNLWAGQKQAGKEHSPKLQLKPAQPLSIKLCIR